MLGRDVLIDADDVLLDTQPHTIRCLVETFGRVASVQSRDDLRHWDLRRSLLPGEVEYIERYLWSSEEWWKSVPVVIGAQEGVEELRALGLHPVVTTAPWKCSGWVRARYTLMEKLFGIPEEDVHIGAGKHRIAGRMIVDDKPQNIAAWSERWQVHGGTALLFGTPNNRSDECEHLSFAPTTYQRVEHWAEVIEIARSL